MDWVERVISSTSNPGAEEHTQVADLLGSRLPVAEASQQDWFVMKSHKPIPFPPIVEREWDHTQFFFRCGVFANVGRVYMIFDNRLVLWRVQGQDNVLHYEAKQTIYSCALFAPPAGLVQDEVTHLLVLVTSGEVIVLAVGLTEDVMMLSRSQRTTDIRDITVTSLYATEEGRCVVGDTNGHIYEVCLTSAATFESLTLRVRNLTSSLPPVLANLLNWAKPSMVVSIVGARLSRTPFLFTLQKNGTFSVYQCAGDGEYYHTNTNNRPGQFAHDFASLHRVSEGEAVSFVAVDVVGQWYAIRVSQAHYFQSAGVNVSYTLIREMSDGPSAVLDAFHVSTGAVFSCTSVDSDKQSVNAFCFPLKRQNPDSENVIQGRENTTRTFVRKGLDEVRGRVLCVAELPQHIVSGEPREAEHELFAAPRLFALITNQGTYYVQKRRPIDIILETVNQCSKDNCMKEILHHKYTYFNTEFCFLLLLLMREQHTHSSRGLVTHTNDPVVYELLDKIGATPLPSRTHTFRPAAAVGDEEEQVTVLEMAMLRMLGRAVQPIWEVQVLTPDCKKVNFNRVLLDKIGSVLNILRIIANHYQTMLTATSTRTIEAIQNVTEGVYVLLQLSHYNFKPGDKPGNLKFVDFVNSDKGRPLLSHLVFSVLEHHKHNVQEVEFFLAAFQKNCPVMFRQESIFMYWGALELERINGLFSNGSLAGAFQHFARAAPNISVDQLHTICNKFLECRHQDGWRCAVRLALAVQACIPLQNATERKQCYDCCKKVLVGISDSEIFERVKEILASIDNKELHIQLFEWLSTNKKYLMPKLESKYFEEWLGHTRGENTAVLIEYLKSTGKFEKLSKLYEELASKEVRQQDRVSLLALAVNAKSEAAGRAAVR